MKKIFNQVANFIKTNRAISAAIAVVIITVAIGIGFIVANLGNSQNGSGAPDPSNPGYTEPPATSHQHLYAAETIQASCGHGGCTLYTCECGHSYTEDETPALEHELSDWVVTQEPTPENEGQKEQRCLHCNHRIVETIPKLEKHEHTFDDKVVKPTCSEKGYTSHTCSTCGYKYSDNHTSALGHSWSAWAETGKTSDAGMIEVSRSCKNCKKTETDFISKQPEAHSHTWSETVVAPTCTKDGYTQHLCKCGESYQSNTVSKTGHLYGSWVTTIQPTTSSVGEKKCTCQICGHELKETLAKLEQAVADKQEGLDPRITVKINAFDGTTAYKYGAVRVNDCRTWGDAPSISINAKNGFDIIYYKQNGQKVTYTLNPAEGYVSFLTIWDDGSYENGWIGDFSD